jgi:hypothetical protein
MERQRANQKTTKAVVARYMKEKRLSSGETTHNIIKELIDEGKLNIEVINSQVHFLTVNENNEFNKIYNFLSEIEKIMDRIYLAVGMGLAETIAKIDNSTEELIGSTEVNLCITIPYRESVNIMLLELMAIIDNEIPSEKDKQILNSRILQLQRKLTFQFEGIRNSDTILNNIISDIKFNLKKAKYIQKYAKKHNININSTNDLIEIIDNFKKEFLSQSN